MLYPIELLRHKMPAKLRVAIDGVHVNGRACLCHVIRGLFKCRQMSRESLKFSCPSQKRTSAFPAKEANPMIISLPPILNDSRYTYATSKSAICHYPVQIRKSDRIRMGCPLVFSEVLRGQRTRPETRIGKFSRPVRISDNWCWQNAFIQLNICHRIDANELANLRHDTSLYQFRLNIWPERLSYQTSCGQSREPLP